MIDAPKSPPINACEELDGIPKRQVINPHIIAPNSAQRITNCVIVSAETIPTPIVFATWVPHNAPTQSKNAAYNTAYLGLSALVEIAIEMALAESWKPLINSNINATPTNIIKQIIVTVITNYS